ncbi:MAG: VWA domain-containing protein [Acidobacteria bacterium]|nr:VWA domain-containing protein [Acidobacteriota bacterium]
MFELLFKYPASAFSKGQLVLLGAWPVWTLVLAIAAGAAALGWLVWRRRLVLGPLGRAASLWVLQAAFLALLLLMLWRPALSIATLKPQQNIVGVLIDDSKSMAIAENGATRRDQAAKALDSGLLQSLKDRFQVRLYRVGDGAARMEKTEQLNAAAPVTRLSDALRQVAAESSNLPVGAFVLLTDGADNSGGVDPETIATLRQHRIPVHTVGFGFEALSHDVELSDLQLPPRTLADSRVLAQVAIRQSGFAGQSVRLTLRDSGKALASQSVVLGSDGAEQIVSVLFNAGPAGVRNLEASIEPLQGEANASNNRLTRVMDVDGAKPRVLYIEGEPRWEFKFIRRAIDEDKSLKLASILRTTQNKIYRQGVESENELAQGFPTKPEELFAFQGLIIGSVEANWFTNSQQELIKEFADRRGGGVLFLGGRFGLSDGGYNQPPFTEMLPVDLPSGKNTYHPQSAATVELTQAGRDSLLTRLIDNPDANVERWKKLPYLMNWQDPGSPKKGALTLVEMSPGGSTRKLPALITENYGHGRTAVFATSGSWRWQMLQPLADQTHEIFWQQMLRWLVSGSPGRLVLTTSKSLLADQQRVHLRAEVRDKLYETASDAQVEAHILGPDGLSERVALRPDPRERGVYTADWDAPKPGSYLTEAIARRGDEELGRDVLTFRREDGVAENFHTEQNRELLEKLSSQTGGRYYRPGEVKQLANEIEYSESGITVRETRDLWNMPVVFLLALALRASEWVLRRRWGVI